MSVAPASAHPGREPHRPRWVLVATLAFLLGGLTVAILYHSDVLGGSSDSISENEGSGVPATQARDVGAFHGIDLAGSNNVVIRVGEKQSVVVKADDNLLDRVTTEVQSGKLVIANAPGSFTTNSPMSVEVGVPSLDTLTLSGSGNIVVTGVAVRRAYRPSHHDGRRRRLPARVRDRRAGPGAGRRGARVGRTRGALAGGSRPRPRPARHRPPARCAGRGGG